MGAASSSSPTQNTPLNYNEMQENAEDMATAQTNIPVDENVPENTVGELQNANKYKNRAPFYDETSREIRLGNRPSKGTLDECISSDIKEKVKSEKKPYHWEPIPRDPDADTWEQLKPMKREELIPKPTPATPIDMTKSSTNDWPPLSSVHEPSPTSLLTEPTPAYEPSRHQIARRQRRLIGKKAGQFES